MGPRRAEGGVVWAAEGGGMRAEGCRADGLAVRGEVSPARGAAALRGGSMVAGVRLRSARAMLRPAVLSRWLRVLRRAVAALRSAVRGPAQLDSPAR